MLAAPSPVGSRSFTLRHGPQSADAGHGVGIGAGRLARAGRGCRKTKQLGPVNSFIRLREFVDGPSISPPLRNAAVVRPLDIRNVA